MPKVEWFEISNTRVEWWERYAQYPDKTVKL